MRSGEFNLFANEDLLSLPTNETEVIFNDFKILNIDYLVIGKIIKDGISISVVYDIFDISKGKKIRTSTVYGIPNKNRQLGHYVSDGIYEEITGMKGISSTKILYVTENKNFNLMVADADGSNEQILLKSNDPIISPAWSPDSKKIILATYSMAAEALDCNYSLIGSGPAIFLTHGIGAAEDAWRFIVPKLSKNFTVKPAAIVSQELVKKFVSS